MDEQRQPLIHMEDVSKIFYTEEIETHALSKVSLDICSSKSEIIRKFL